MSQVSAPSATPTPITLKINKAQLRMVALALVLRLCMDLAYAYLAQPLYAYSGYYLDPNWGYVAISYAMTAVLGFLLPSDQEKPSSNIGFVYFIIFYLPFGTIFSLMPASPTYYWLVTGGFAIMFGILRLFPETKPLPKVRRGAAIFITMAVLFIGYTLAIFALRGGFSIITFNLSEIYSVRGIINYQILTGLAGYTSTWVVKVFIPALLVYGLWKRNWVLTVIAALLVVLFFGVTSSKAAFLYPFLVLFAYFGHKIGRFRDIFMAAVFAVVGVAWLSYLILGDIIVAGVLVQRALFIPTRTCFTYFEFFQSHPLVYMSNSIFSRFLTYPYHSSIPDIIGFGSYGAGSQTYENVGIFGTGYEHFGAIGVLLFPLIAGLTLKVIDIISYRRMPARVALAFAIVVGIQYTSADLAETLLTHGMFLTWITLLMFGETSNAKPIQSAAA